MTTLLQWRFLVFPIIWTGIVGLLCGLPGSGFPNLSLWTLLTFDKAAHAFVYAMFTFLWSGGLCKQYLMPHIQQRSIRYALIGGVAYGILIEILQGYVFRERSMEFNDVIANSTGALIGIGIFRLIYPVSLFKH